jgi:hypothetical protein
MLKSLASARGNGGRPFKIAAKLWLAHASQPVRGEDRRFANAHFFARQGGERAAEQMNVFGVVAVTQRAGRQTPAQSRVVISLQA